jgi:RHS repeat-associated protein
MGYCLQDSVSAPASRPRNDYGAFRMKDLGQDLSQSLQGAGGIGGLLCVIRNGESFFPCSDGNGNVTDYVSTNGTVVAHREYDPFGNTVASTGPMKDAFTFWFSAKYYEPTWNLYYYGYRWYSQNLHIFLSRDPLDEETFGFRSASLASIIDRASQWRNKRPNIYVYCLNCSVNLIDPWGLKTKTCYAFMLVKVPFTDWTFVNILPSHGWIQIDGDQYGLYPSGLQHDESQWYKGHYEVFCTEVTPEKCITTTELDGLVKEAIKESNTSWTIFHTCFSWVAEVMLATSQKETSLQNAKQTQCIEQGGTWELVADPSKCCICPPEKSTQPTKNSQ